MLNQDYKDMLSALLERRVDFLIVGAYAMAVHGYPRATGDIDIFIKPTKENAGRVLEALGNFGVPLERISAADFEIPGTVFQIGVAPRRIDLLTEIDGVTFEDGAADKDIVEVEGLPLPFISKKKLRQNKLASGREKDLLDAATLDG